MRQDRLAGYWMLNAFSRMVARRGNPEVMICDNWRETHVS